MMETNSFKVLIADDEPNILMPLEFLMKKEGYKVLVARNGAEARSLIDKELPDVFILDVMMPGYTGTELSKYIRTHEKIKEALIIFISARNSREDIEEGYSAGANVFLSKPFSTKKMISIIKEHLQKYLI